jgi:putative membrane protein insertion efficiency factor
VALLALRFYKAYLSILFAGSCRFEPTCSQYAYEAIERFGVARGVWLGVKRLLRCQPLSRKFGYDPVPEKKENMGLQMNSAASAGRSSRAATEVDS